MSMGKIHPIKNVGLGACDAWVYGPCMPVLEAVMRSYMYIYRQNDARDRKCITLHACKALCSCVEFAHTKLLTQTT